MVSVESIRILGERSNEERVNSKDTIDNACNANWASIGSFLAACADVIPTQFDAVSPKRSLLTPKAIRAQQFQLLVYIARTDSGGNYLKNSWDKKVGTSVFFFFQSCFISAWCNCNSRAALEMPVTAYCCHVMRNLSIFIISITIPGYSTINISNK